MFAKVAAAFLRTSNEKQGRGQLRSSDLRTSQLTAAETALFVDFSLTSAVQTAQFCGPESSHVSSFETSKKAGVELEIFEARFRVFEPFGPRGSLWLR